VTHRTLVILENAGLSTSAKRIAQLFLERYCTAATTQPTDIYLRQKQTWQPFSTKRNSMIPLRLHLKNFLSYGANVQPLNLEPYTLICLSGKNGHGKSALLDALTWLFGTARKGSGVAKADEVLYTWTKPYDGHAGF